MKRLNPQVREAAEAVAIQSLSFIAGDSERLGRFLVATGIGPAEIRSASHDPEFLTGVLDYVLSDEPLLLAFAADADLRPGDVVKSHAALAGLSWERDVP